MVRRSFRRGITFHHVGDLRRAVDASTGRAIEFSPLATPTVDALLGRSGAGSDPEIEAALEAHSLLEPTISRRESLVVTGSAAGLITTFMLPSALAAASTAGVAFADADDGGAVTTSIIEVDGVQYDLYEIKYTLTSAENNATITRSMTLSADTTVDLLLVGGGGGGGGFSGAVGYGGGGGAGELVDIRGIQLVDGLYTITVGAGGSAGADAAGGPGAASSIRLNGAGTDTAYAAGGGGGGGRTTSAAAGGSSGGRESGGGTGLAAGTPSSLPTVPADASAAAAYLEAGGGASDTAGGAGGGAGGDGGSGVSNAGGAGGSGRNVGGEDFLADALVLAIGGGGSGAGAGGDGRGGLDSWGKGAGISPFSFSAPGLNGTGDGGGGGLRAPGGTFGAARGATGVVFIRIPRP